MITETTSTVSDSNITQKIARVVQACKDVYPTQKETCNFFVRDVYLKLTGVTLTGNADTLVDTFSGEKSGWKKTTAADSVGQVNIGKFVVAGLKSGEHKNAAHGHVAVVVQGTLYRGKYPVVWCGGSERGRSEGTKSVGEVWAPGDRDNVKYFVSTEY